MDRCAAIALTALLSVTAPVAVAHPGNCVVNAEDGGRSADFDLDANIELDGEDVVFEREHRVVARIIDRKVLEIGGKRVELDRESQKTVTAYADEYHRLVDDAKEIGLAGARLGASAAIRAVTSVFTGGDADEVEREIESEAKEIEAMAVELCESVAKLRVHHEVLSRQVPEFGTTVPIRD